MVTRRGTGDGRWFWVGVLALPLACKADTSTSTPAEPSPETATVAEADPVAAEVPVDEGEGSSGQGDVAESEPIAEASDAEPSESSPPQPAAEGAPTQVVAAADAPEGDAAQPKQPSKPKADKEPAPLPKPIDSNVNASCGKDVAVGTKLKPFKLKTVGGKEVSRGSFGRRVLLVNFWGTWCKPCLQELPEFDRLYRRYRKHGLTLVAIATDEDPGPVQDFLKKRKLAAKALVGGEDYASGYGSAKFPFTFVVDPDGNIVSSFVGYKPECAGAIEASIREQIEKHR